MDDQWIRVNWRAAIILNNGRDVIHGCLHRLGKGKAIVRADCNLRPGFRCGLALMLPKAREGDPVRIVEGHGMVTLSLVSAMQFHITLDRLVYEGGGEALLERHLRAYGKTLMALQ